MLSNETMKALIEAMLFASDRPVTLRHMVARIRHILRKEQEALAGSVPDAEAEFIEADASDSDAHDALDADTAEGLETAPALTQDPDEADSSAALDTFVPEQEASESSFAPSEAQDTAANENLVADDDSSHVDEFAATEDDGAMAQLLEKQKQLDDEVNIDVIKKLLLEIDTDLQQADRGLELVQVAKGYQFRTKDEISRYLKDEKKAAPSRLSPSSLETLAIVAYEQPVNRTRLEDIRGVDCGGVLKTLLDKELVRIVGRSEEPGRPLVYGTTNKFLEVFGLNSLRDLPNPSEFAEISESGDANVEVVAEGQEVDDGNEYIHQVDFADPDATLLSDSERAILDELDESLSSLKDVEKGIELFQKPQEPEAQPQPVTDGTQG